jgi:hypothetical protein
VLRNLHARYICLRLCSGFTPVLAAKYRALCDASGGASSAPVAIVFVSSDRDQSSFQSYYAEMPWLALPFAAREQKEDLSDLYGIRSARIRGMALASVACVAHAKP